MTTTTHRKRRLAAGLYDVETAFGPASVLRHSDSGEWFITYPGDDMPGDVTGTLAQAVDLVAWWAEAKAEREARYAAANAEEGR